MGQIPEMIRFSNRKIKLVLSVETIKKRIDISSSMHAKRHQSIGWLRTRES